MLRGMTTRQFGEWRSYADLEPFDETRADLRSADIVRTLINLLGRKKGAPAVPLKDCVLRFGGEAAKPVTPESARAQVLQTMEILMAIHSGRRKAPEKPSGRSR